jgi:hypothetical protein
MNQNIKNFIEEGEKLLDEKFPNSKNLPEYETVSGKDSYCLLKHEWNGNGWTLIPVREDIKQFISSRQILLIKMIVEMCCKDCQNKIQCINEKKRLT